ncbi:hypothetical protein AB0O34_05035 [Sphaerisporangium sp. NPDC088356]|uniref:hypothetical protein n=1 Tax=Sphaerisporangium sp. NPDC088356 TaxID=3154871 RepID=UPI00344883EC
MPRVAVCALLLLPTAACDSPATLDEAARILAKDGNELATFHYLENKRVTDETGKDGDDPIACPEGTARRSYRFIGDLGTSKAISAKKQVDLAGLPFGYALLGLGYELDHSTSSVQSGRRVGVWRKKKPGLTVTLVMRSSVPNVEIIGKTDCLVPTHEASSPSVP